MSPKPDVAEIGKMIVRAPLPLLERLRNTVHALPRAEVESLNAASVEALEAWVGSKERELNDGKPFPPRVRA